LIACRGRGVHATETKHGHGHADCAAGLASTPHVDAVGPPVYVAPATEAESGVSAFFASAAAASYSGKRARVEDHQFVGATKRRVIDVHPAVLHHVSALTFLYLRNTYIYNLMETSIGIDARRTQWWRMQVQRLNAEVQQWQRYAAAVASQLMAKDEEIGAARRLNRLIEEQVHAAHAKAQAWRDAATSSEAAAAALRADLDHVLCARARNQDEDAESCCSGSNDYEDGCEGDNATTSSSCVAGACRRCGARAAAVVLLPCRHLSACTPCAAALRACPACGLVKAGSVAVNPV
jgi:E3 ubiquitin-protein ligase BOI and related proteins